MYIIFLLEDTGS